MTARRRIYSFAAAGVALGIVVAAAVNGWSQPRPGGYRVASAPVKSDYSMLAEARGRLQGQVNPDGTACFWLGDMDHRRALFWPYGYTGGGTPLAVYDESGKRVATVGQYVVMAGGLLPDSVHSIPGCAGITDIWDVGFVVETR